MSPRLVIIGVPGSGVPQVCSLVGRRLGCPVVDTDEELARGQGMPVQDLFIGRDQAQVRDLERQAALAGLTTPGVVGLGGGAPMDPQVQAALRGLPVVWLRVSATEAIRRTGVGGIRPAGLGNLRAMMATMVAQRNAVYEQLSRWVVDTDGLAPEQVADRVIGAATAGEGNA